MRNAYVHFVCDMPECSASFDTPDQAVALPPKWAWVDLQGRDFGLIKTARICDTCVVHFKNMGVKN